MEYLDGSVGVKKKPKDELDPYPYSIYLGLFSLWRTVGLG